MSASRSLSGTLSPYLRRVLGRKRLSFPSLLSLSPWLGDSDWSVHRFVLQSESSPHSLRPSAPFPSFLRPSSVLPPSFLRPSSVPPLRPPCLLLPTFTLAHHALGASVRPQLLLEQRQPSSTRSGLSSLHTYWLLATEPLSPSPPPPPPGAGCAATACSSKNNLNSSLCHKDGTFLPRGCWPRNEERSVALLGLRTELK